MHRQAFDPSLRRTNIRPTRARDCPHFEQHHPELDRGCLRCVWRVCSRLFSRRSVRSRAWPARRGVVRNLGWKSPHKARNLTNVGASGAPLCGEVEIRGPEPLTDAGQTGPGPPRSASLQNAGPEAPIPVKLRVVSAHFRQTITTISAPGSGQVVPTPL